MIFCKDCKYFIKENPIATPTCGHSSATYRCSDWAVTGRTSQWDCEQQRIGLGLFNLVGAQSCGVRARYFEPRT